MILSFYILLIQILTCMLPPGNFSFSFPISVCLQKVFSTKTALIRIQNDLLLAMNRKQVSALILLIFPQPSIPSTTAYYSIGSNLILEYLTSHSHYFQPISRSALSQLSLITIFCKSIIELWRSRRFSSWSTSIHPLYHPSQ